MDQQPKVAISVEADKYLEEMKNSVNEGYSSGKVTKSQLATWIIGQFWLNLTTKQIERVRADHFDEVAHLENVVERLKEARKTNASIPMQDLLAPVLQKQIASTQKAKKKNANATNDETESQ